MSVLSQTEPKEVFRFFEELSQIPRGTYNTKAVSDYCVRFARERNLTVIQDAWNNVIIKKPGTAGYENSEPVIIQGHLDMVCEKEADSSHDFMKDPLELYVEDGFVKARGTTLGADDGIAVAYALAVLDDQEMPHPPIEAVFTVDEEVGMDGAANIDLSVLEGKMLLNLDSEDENILTAGCAGGFRFDCRIPICRETVKGTALEVKISGLKGGHSGVEIHKQRGNANKLAGRLLYRISREQKLYLESVSGGAKDNVIPSVHTARIVIQDLQQAKKIIEEMEYTWKQELGSSESDLQVQTVELGDGKFSVLSLDSTKRVLTFLVGCPNGVYEYSRSLAGLVETSDNLGIVSTSDDAVIFGILSRSGRDSKLEEMKERFISLAESVSAQWQVESEYPSWTYKEDSRIRPLAADVFEEVFGVRPEITIIHAGLECGLLSGQKPD